MLLGLLSFLVSFLTLQRHLILQRTLLLLPHLGRSPLFHLWRHLFDDILTVFPLAGHQPHIEYLFPVNEQPYVGQILVELRIGHELGNQRQALLHRALGCEARAR